MDFSLDRIRALVALLPRYTRPTIHIAGTNGKGSTTAFVDAILRQAGYTTGRFNSPHLVTIPDSIRVNGNPIPPEDYQEAQWAVANVDHSAGCCCTNFELLTTTALIAFERADVDVVILEVGLGGRLDATNVIPDDCVLVSGITSVSLDHQAILGRTVEAIAREKAGIARKGVPCVLADQDHSQIIHSAADVIESRGANCILASDLVSLVAHDLRTPARSSTVSIVTMYETMNCNISLNGAHQLANAKLAVALVTTLRHDSRFRIQTAHISEGLSSTTWPGRLEWLTMRLTGEKKIDILVDGAHNPSSSVALAKYLELWPRPRSFILSLSSSPSKSPRPIMEPLLAPGDRVAVVSFQPVEGMPWVQPMDTDVMVRSARDILGPDGDICAHEDLLSAIRWASQRTGVIVIAGSLYLVADTYRCASQNNQK